LLLTCDLATKDILKEECVPGSDNQFQMIKIPNLKNSWQIQKDCLFPTRENVSYAIGLFYDEWSRRFGDPEGKVKNTLNNLMIKWEHERKVIHGVAFDMEGQPVRGKIKGLTITPTYLWVWTNPKYKRIAATALVHELVHSALWTNIGIHGDPDHEGLDFLGWTRAHTEFIEELNRVLAYKDI
jgi:hypothetical protein